MLSASLDHGHNLDFPLNLSSGLRLTPLGEPNGGGSQWLRSYREVVELRTSGVSRILGTLGLVAVGEVLGG